MGFIQFDFDRQVGIHGPGEFVASIGSVLVGFFIISQDTPVLAVGVVALSGGGIIFLWDTFGLDLGSRDAT